MAAARTTPTPPGSLKRIVAASLIGTTIEWYDNSSGQSYDLPFLPHGPLKSAPNQHGEISCWPGHGEKLARTEHGPINEPEGGH